MHPGKRVLFWHMEQEKWQENQQALAALAAKQNDLLQAIEQLENKLSALEPPLRPEEEVNRLLSEQELWMARKAYNRHLEESETTRLALESSISRHELAALELQQELQQEHIQEYFRIKETKTNPVVEVKNSSCMGCFRLLSLHNLDQWRRGVGLVTCEECGRILA